MTIKRIYSCNICGDQETPSGHQGKEVVLIGYQFTGSGVGAEIVMKGSREVEHHICKTCLKGMNNLYYQAGGDKL